MVPQRSKTASPSVELAVGSTATGPLPPSSAAASISLDHGSNSPEPISRNVRVCATAGGYLRWAEEVLPVDPIENEVSEQGIVKTLEAAGDVRLERALVGVVSARDVSLQQAGAGPVAAQGDVNITQGGCGPVLVGGDLTIRQGGCGPSMVRGSLSIQQGGTQSVLAAGTATIGRGAFVGLVASPRVTIEDGARVLVGKPAAFAAGAALGAVIALVARKRRSGD